MCVEAMVAMACGWLPWKLGCKHSGRLSCGYAIDSYANWKPVTS